MVNVLAENALAKAEDDLTTAEVALRAVRSELTELRAALEEPRP